MVSVVAAAVAVLVAIGAKASGLSQRRRDGKDAPIIRRRPSGVLLRSPTRCLLRNVDFGSDVSGSKVVKSEIDPTLDHRLLLTFSKFDVLASPFATKLVNLLFLAAFYFLNWHVQLTAKCRASEGISVCVFRKLGTYTLQFSCCTLCCRLPILMVYLPCLRQRFRDLYLQTVSVVHE